MTYNYSSKRKVKESEGKKERKMEFKKKNNLEKLVCKINSTRNINSNNVTREN